LLTYANPVDTHLEAAGIMKQLDGQGTLFFAAVKSYAMPVVGNLLCSKETCEAAFGLDYRELRECIARALSASARSSASMPRSHSRNGIALPAVPLRRCRSTGRSCRARARRPRVGSYRRSDMLPARA
jgi:3-polyprenyl-4-hydroxybenzoate decarboxylase